MRLCHSSESLKCLMSCEMGKNVGPFYFQKCEVHKRQSSAKLDNITGAISLPPLGHLHSPAPCSRGVTCPPTGDPLALAKLLPLWDEDRVQEVGRLLRQLAEEEGGIIMEVLTVGLPFMEFLQQLHVGGEGTHACMV